MANSPSVNLTKRIQIKSNWVFCPVVYSSRRQIRPNVVMVQGKEERHEEGRYYIDWREDGKRFRQKAGKDAAEAEGKRDAKERELAAISAGVPVLAQSHDQTKTSLASAIAVYLAEIKLTKKSKTYDAYKNSLEYFQQSCKKTLQEIDRQDMNKFSVFLRDEKSQSPRSCWNKFSNVMSFLKSQGALKKTRNGTLTTAGVEKNDWPTYTEEVPEVYEKEDLEELFAACNAEERLWYEFFWMTGMREQEVMYTYWADINLVRATVRVSHKPDRNWTPKAYKEREIPIPAKLVESLKARKATRDGKCNLLFPTSGFNIKLDFLDCLKRIAERAGLIPDSCWLHKFRATFATMHLRNGVDISTVQKWMGHSDLQSTMRYLRHNDRPEVRDKVNSTFA